MNITSVAIGLLFFINPTYGIYDVLPDFIGAALIIFGIGDCVWLDEKLDKGANLLWIAAAGGVARFALSFVWSGFDGTAKMLACFCLAVFDAALIVLSVSSLTSGLENVKIRYGAVFDEKQKYDISNLKTPLCVYTVVRCVLFFLPEATELRLVKSSGISENMLLTGYKGLLYGIALVINLVPALAAVIRVLKTMRGLGSDTAMLTAARTAAGEKTAENPLGVAEKKHRTARVIFLIGAVFSLYFYVDNSDAVPKTVAALALALLGLCLGKSKAEKALSLAPAGALAVLQITYTFLSRSYFSNFSEENAVWVAGATREYTVMSAVAVLMAAVQSVLLLHTVRLMKRSAEEKISLGGDPTDSYIKDLLAKNDKACKVCAVLAVLLCACAALYVPLRPTTGSITLPLMIFDALFLVSAWAM